MKKEIKKDKRMLILYAIVFLLLIIGFTYAIGITSLGIDLSTGKVAIDFDAYGSTSFDASKLDIKPIQDSDVETSLDNVIKIEFKVGGASSNNTNNIIYGIALNDLKVDCSLLSPYVKWKLLKNETALSTGSLDYKFDTITNGRLVLTETQQDLPAYSASQTGYDNYTFYLWLSDSCQSTDLEVCKTNNQIEDQTSLLGKILKGKIEVELYTGTKKTLTRNPSTTLDSSTCGTYSLLSLVEPGSYVQYTGTNGCTGESCNGQNANYVSDTDMGYCSNSGYKFSVNGWRVGYIKDGSAYLVAAGANVCLCTDADGVTTSSSCRSNATPDGVPIHIARLNQASLEYCNPEFAYGGSCNSNSAWAMNATDFQNITGKALSSNSCYASSSDPTCGYGNDLIDNGGYYWYATPYTSTSTFAFGWNPYDRNVNNYTSNIVSGARAVLRLESSVVVVGGSGTYEDPYQISNST